MLLPIKPICERKDVRRDGTSLVNIQYCYSSRHRTNLNTGIAIPPEFWIKKSQRIAANLPSNYGDPIRLNEEITRLFRMAEDIITFATKSKLDNIPVFVKKTFHPDFDVRSLMIEENANKLIESFPLDIRANPNIFDQIDSYIESKKKKVSDATIDVYKAMKHHLQEFQAFRKKKITFKSLDIVSMKILLIS